MECRFCDTVFYNSENGYTVATYVTEEPLPEKAQKETGQFVAVGYELPQESGLNYSFSGKWKESAKYGEQFHVESVQIHLPTTGEGVKAYLSSGLIKGIGPALAERIVEKFGKHTFYVFEQCPQRLLEIPGISERKLEEIKESYRKSESLRKLSLFLSSAGVTPKKLKKIQEHFGDAAVSIVRKDPFRLCEIEGFGFQTVDPIARKVKNFKPDNPLRLRAAILYVLQVAEIEGHLYLEVPEILQKVRTLIRQKGKDSIVTDRKIRDAGNSLLGKNEPLVCSYRRIYLRKNYEDEQEAALQLAMLCKCQVAQINVKEKIHHLEKKEGICLTPTQRKGIENAFSNPVSIITGGPGSGKTMILRFIVMIQEMLDMDSMTLLAAPTGRARQRMYEATGYPAMTIHRSIGLTGEAGEEAWNHGQSLPDDLIIVDECSMVDMHLFAKFVKQIKKGSRILFVGDKDQLESVGPGDVFRELILSSVIPVTVLDQCFRQENQTILENARKINFGKTNLVYNDCFCFVPAQNQEVAGHKIEKLFYSEWKGMGKSANAVQVLTARKEDAEILNQKIRDRINPPAPGKREIKNGSRIFRIQDKVMQTKNVDEISNGDIGVVSRIWQKDGIWQMDVDFGDERIKTYVENEYWNLELAYAITVYKGQGSEYEIVIIPVLSCYWRALRRNLYYTAVTRAKRKVILVGSKQALAQAIRTGKGKGRNTILGARLRKVYRYLKSEEKK